MYNLSTKAHEGPQQPTKADSGPQGWKTAHRYVFFYNVFFFKIYNLFTQAYEGPQQPTTANKGQQRPAAAHGRPTQAHKDGKKAHKGPQQPTKADAGPDSILL